VADPSETTTPLLPSVKADKHRKYRYSEKGKERDYRRYKARLLERMFSKAEQIVELERIIAEHGKKERHRAREV
jgi:hypothetical protein